jgi:hypothetical protein
MDCYGTGYPKTAVHASPNCPRLVVGRKHPVVKLPDTMFRVNRLCKACFSGQVSSVHVRCRVCHHKEIVPCPHNGGVLVEGPTRLLWAWPEDAYTRTLVNPLRMQ